MAGPSATYDGFDDVDENTCEYFGLEEPRARSRKNEFFFLCVFFDLSRDALSEQRQASEWCVKRSWKETSFWKFHQISGKSIYFFGCRWLLPEEKP